MADVPTQIVHLDIGEKIGLYTVTAKLGEGTFGAVYKVRTPDGEEGALKTEHISMKLLALELHVMQKLTENAAQFCCVLSDKGRTETFTFIVMKLVGMSLQDAKKMGPNKHMSTGCAISAAMQCLEGLRELHATGYLHRDIKPGNYAVGLEEKNELRRIYLLDFGMCKLYRHRGEWRQIPPGKFRGTPRYAPLASHRLLEHARRDDLESWLYMLIDFCNGSLPWKVTSDLKEIGSIKEQCRKGPMLDQMMAEVPPEIRGVLEHIDGLGFLGAPDYTAMMTMMKNAIANNGHREFPYDWESKTPVSAPEAKKTATRKTTSVLTSVNGKTPTAKKSRKK